MKLRDSIFGDVEVHEPVLIDLINSKPLERLKGIHAGGPCQYTHELFSNSRFEHCVGVMLLLRHFEASLEEQIAGLLHDVSHTAFSHAGDYVFGDAHTQGYQDSILQDFILKSEIPEILARHGMAAESVVDPRNFSLLEQEIPDLCADRMDYSLRHPAMLRYLAPLTPQDVFSYVQIAEGKFVMTSPAVAWKYARAFLQWYSKELASPLCAASFQLIADVLKRALLIGTIIKEDMFQNDQFVYQKLKISSDPEIQNYLELLTPKLTCTVDQMQPDFFGRVKDRYIDPLVKMSGGALVRVSHLYPDFAQELSQQHERLHKKEIPIRITSIAKAHISNAGVSKA